VSTVSDGLGECGFNEPHESHEYWLVAADGRPVTYACPGLPESRPSDGLAAAPGRWAFLDPETGDWIEVKPGVVFVRAKR
jgi:hypothetical protein